LARGFVGAGRKIDAIQVPVRTGLTADIGGRRLNTNGEGVSEKLDASRRSVSSEYRGMKFGTERPEYGLICGIEVQMKSLLVRQE
jgi:hypothetical protein